MTVLTTGTNFNNGSANGYVIADGFSGPAGAAATFPNGAVLSGGSTFAHGDLKLLGTSTGATTLNSGLAAGSNNTITLPVTASDTLAGLGTAQTFTALQKFTNADFAILGSSTGYTLLESGLASTSNNTLTLPSTAADTLAALGTVQTWTAAQTFTNSDILLLGSSTGATTFASANAGASNYTLTFPAATDQLVGRATVDTLTNKTLTAPVIGGLPLFSAATPAAAGSTVTDATQLTAMFNAVTGADGTKGVKLPPTPAAGTVVVVKNNAGSTLKVWPDAAATINAISSNADLPILTNAACLLFATSATQWWSVPLVPS